MLKNLKDEFNQIQSFGTEVDYINYASTIGKMKDADVVKYHFSLLARSEGKFQFFLGNSFKKRGLAVESFLVDAYENEKTPTMKGLALQILGQIESSLAAPLARKSTQSKDPDLRYRGLIVLGWTGGIGDYELLSNLMLHDGDASIRGFSATSIRQIWWRFETGQEELEKSLCNSISVEKDVDALALMLISLQSISGKTFGLTENPQENSYEGDVQKAKIRANKLVCC